MKKLEDILPLLLGDDRFQYIPNRGNAGDALIAAATGQVLGRIGARPDDSSRTLLVAGGGGLHPKYRCLANRLMRTPRDRRVIILPSSVSAHWDLLRQFDDLTLLSRDEVTHRLAGMNGIHSLMCHDAAFSYQYPVPTQEHELLVSFRTDAERTIAPPPGNKEPSLAAGDLWTPSNALPAARAFAMNIGSYRSIRTNYCHVAIAAACMGVEVYLHHGSYFKNRAVFDASLAGCPIVGFVE